MATFRGTAYWQIVRSDSPKFRRSVAIGVSGKGTCGTGGWEAQMLKNFAPSSTAKSIAAVEYSIPRCPGLLIRAREVPVFS